MRVWQSLLALTANSGVDAVGHLNREIAAVAESIPAVSREIEERYLRSSSVLEPLTNASEALNVQSAELLKLAKGQSDGDLVVNETVDLLTASFAYLDRWGTEVRAHLSELAACEEIFARLQSSQVTLNGLVSPLKHIQTMFRIEAARLPEEVRQIFAALTDQIAAVHGEVTETFAGQFQIVAHTLTTLDQVRGEISQHTSQLQKVLTDRRSRVAASIDTLRHELARNSERETQLTSTSRAIAASITNIVIGLQAHDICSQRLENVCLVIKEVHQALDALQNGTHNDQERLQEAWCSLTVQTAQLDAVYQHFETSEKDLQSAVQEVRSKVRNSDSECSLFLDFQQVTAATTSSVVLSLEMMLESAELLRGVITRSRDFCSSLQPLAQTTSRLTDALEGLSNKMRWIALNAQVQAVLIGSGTGLEILAAQTASISAATSLSAERVAGDIQSLVEVVRKLTASLQGLTAEGEEGLQLFEKDSFEHETTLRKLGDGTLQHLQMVGKAVDEIDTCTTGLREDSQHRQAAVAPLRRLASRLSEISAQMKSQLSRLDAQVASNLKTHYKMHSERQVHRDVLAGMGVNRSAELPGDGSPVPSETEMSVELF